MINCRFTSAQFFSFVKRRYVGGADQERAMKVSFWIALVEIARRMGDRFMAVHVASSDSMAKRPGDFCPQLEIFFHGGSNDQKS